MLKKDETLKTEKLYLLKLFVMNAAKAIRNAELRERLLQKEKLSAVGKAVSMMMHDLRSPIKNIKVMTDLMREENVRSEWLGMIDECAVQASGIFEDFMDFIKETPVKKLPVVLDKMIGEGIKLAEAQNTKGQVTIHRDIPHGLVIGGDESKLKRCIMNLVSNAMDALLDLKTPDPRIDITADSRDGGATISVTIRDNGRGIPGDIINTLFEPFVTRKKTNGTGLGLAIVKQYVTAHGGEISVTNDKGAVFTIILPMQS
jgi:two-component system NtrC family sensor kinase